MMTNVSFCRLAKWENIWIQNTVMTVRSSCYTGGGVIYRWCSLSSARHTEGCGAGSWRCCSPAPRGRWLSWQQVVQPCCGARLAPGSGRSLDWRYPLTETSSSVCRRTSRARHMITGAACVIRVDTPFTVARFIYTKGV